MIKKNYNFVGVNNEAVLKGQCVIETSPSAGQISGEAMLNKWLIEEGLPMDAMGNIVGHSQLISGNPIGDDTIGTYKMLTPIVKANKEEFQPVITISSEVSLSFYNKPITNHSRISVDTGLGRDYTTGSYPELMLSYKTKDNTSSTDMHTIAGSYYTDKNVTIIFMNVRCHATGGYHDFIARIKSSGIEFYFSNVDLAVSTAGYNVMLNASVFNSASNALLNKYTFANDFTVLPSIGSASRMAFYLGPEVTIACATSDDGINFSEYKPFKNDSEEFLKSRYLKFKAIYSTSSTTENEYAFEFDQADESSRVKLNEFIEMTSTNISPKKLYIETFEKHTLSENSSIFIKSLDSSMFKKVIALEGKLV